MQPNSIGLPDEDIVFGKSGNASGCQLEGWSFPESGFTWATGAKSTLRLPVLHRKGDWLLILEGHPFLMPPLVKTQTIIVSVDGNTVRQLTLDRSFTRCIRIRKRTSGGDGILELRTPNNMQPSAMGSDDQRHLAVAWRRIRLIPVPSASSDQALTRQFSETVPTATNDGPQFVGDIALPDDNQRRNLQTTLLDCLSTGDMDPIHHLIGSRHGSASASLHLTSEIPTDISLVHCRMETTGHWTFGFPLAWRDSHLAGGSDARAMVAWHWLAMLPLFSAYARSGRVPGPVILNLGDEAHARGLAFCAKTSEALLIPDPYFMRTKGYQNLKDSFTSHNVPFGERKPVALWRGQSTGYRGADGLMGLPRVRLCLYAQQSDNQRLLDVGLTGVVQVQSNGEEAQLRALGVFRDFIHPERFAEWKFHIDIDGNTNSWPGLYQKLVSASVVLKIDSSSGWRQWYYDRLKPYENFIPIEPDFGDLIPKLKFLAYNDKYAAEIGRNGHALVSAMSYEAEVGKAMDVMEDAIVQELLRTQELQHSNG